MIFNELYRESFKKIRGIFEKFSGILKIMMKIDMKMKISDYLLKIVEK